MRGRWLFAAALVVLVGSGTLALALPLSLADWTYTEGASLQGDTAVLKTPGWTSQTAQVTVSQDIQVPIWAALFSFDFKLSIVGPDQTGEDLSFQDFFASSYVDSSPDGPFREFVYATADGPSPPFEATVQPLEDGWFRATADIADLAGRQGTFYFDLYDRDDAWITEAQILNVEIAPVPEPESLVLLGTGLLGLAHVARRRSARG